VDDESAGIVGRAPGQAGPEAAGLALAASLRDHVTGCRGVFRIATAALAGAMSVLSLAPFFLWPILLLTLPVLVFLLDTAEECQSRRTALARAARDGWWFGFGFFTAGLYWIGEAFLVEADKFAWLLPFAVTAMPAGLSLFFAAATAAARYFWRADIGRVVVLALALSATEWLRGNVLTGFPWNVLGYALTAPLALMQTAALIGIYGLTLVTVVALAAPLVSLSGRGGDGEQVRRAGRQIAMLSLAPLLLMAAYGTWRLSGEPVAPHPSAKVRIVQPSVPQRDKWKREKQREIFEDHLVLSRQNALRERDDLAGITHVVWPEAAMPFLPLATPEALTAIGEMLPDGVQLVSGALRLEESRAEGTPATAPPVRRAFNTMIVFNADGLPLHVYDKIHLVPFGEYLPFQTVLEGIGLEQLSKMRGGFSSGVEPRPLLDVTGLPPVGALVCYEAIFPEEVAQGSERPGLFINITNDGWFGDTIGPHQHMQQARVRAVEQGVPLIRAANNGISAVIDADGRVLHALPLNARGVVDSSVPGSRPPPLYSRYGDLSFLLIWLALAAWLVRPVRRPR